MSHIPLFLRVFAKLRKANISSVISVCPSISLPVALSAWNNSAPTRWIFMKFGIWGFFENLSRKFTVYQNLTIITDTLHEDICTYIFGWIIHRIRNVSHKIIEKIKTYSLCSTTFFFRKTCRVWDNVEKNGTAGQGTDEIITLCRKDALCMPETKARIQTQTCNI